MYKTRNVTFNVPAGENYQSDSISAFSGIHITDNPLLADSNSASDMLNLYLTTENTLSTRPRLEFIKKHGLNIKQMISVWKVSEDQILYHYADSNNTIHLDINNQTIDLNNNDVGSNKIRCFKKNDKIYILSENGYFVIKSDNKLYNVINDEDTYIPTTKIVDSSGASTEVDKLNSLSNKYKVLRNWAPNLDITTDISKNIGVKNDYYNVLTETIDSAISVDIIKVLSDGRLVIRKMLNIRTATEDAKFSYYIVEVVNDELFYTPIIENTTSGNIGISDDGNAYVYISNNKLITKMLNVTAPIISVNIDSQYNVQRYVTPNMNTTNMPIKHFFAVSPDGTYAIFPHYTTNGDDSLCIVSNTVVKDTKWFVWDGVYLILTNNRLYKIDIGNTFFYWDLTHDNDIISNIGKYMTITDKKQPVGWANDLKTYYYYDGELIGIYSYTKFFKYDINNDKLTSTQLQTKSNKLIYTNELLYNIDNNNLVVQSLTSKNNAIIANLTLPGEQTANGLYYIWNLNVDRTLTVVYYKPSIEPSMTTFYITDDVDTLKELPDQENNDNIRQFQITTKKTPKLIEFLISYDNVFINYITKLSEKSQEKTFTLTNYGDITFSVPKLRESNIYSSRITLSPTIEDLTLKDFDIEIRLLYNDYSVFTNQIQFYNNYWLSYKNKLYNTQYNDPTYIPESNVSVIGDDTDITGFNLIGNNAMCVYKRNKQFVITASEVDDIVAYSKTEMKTDKGNIPFGETILSAQKNYPLQFDDEGIYVLQIPENINTTENAAVCVSERINGKFIGEPHKENILTHNHLYWTYIMIPSKAETKIYIWDSRNNGWYYWTIPIKVVGYWETLKTYDYVENSDGETIGIFDHDDDWTYQIDEYVGTTNGVDEYQKVEYKRSNPYDYTEKQYTETVLIDDTGCVYNLKVIDYIDTRITGVFKDRGTQFLDIIYRDDDLQYLPISWKWESQIMPMSYTKYNKAYSAINYTKQLVQTGFMFVDSDRTEEYSLNFKFIPYRKKIDENKKAKPIDGTLNYIRSVVKRTRVPKFNFLKIILTDDNKYDKLNLISLKFKYKLMEEKL